MTDGPLMVCPVSRLRCQHAEVCHLIHCSKDRGRRLRPLRERDLTQAEKYALHMDEQQKARALDGSR